MTGLADSLLVVAIAASPIIELRGSIPFAVGVLGMPVAQAVILSLVGNSLQLLAVYAVGGWWIRLMSSRRGFLRRLTDTVLDRSRRVFEGRTYESYGLLALTVFIAIPLPMTGVLTGSVAAFLFGIPLRRAWPYVISGICLAAAVVTLVTTGSLSLLDFLLQAPEI